MKPSRSISIAKFHSKATVFLLLTSLTLQFLPKSALGTNSIPGQSDDDVLERSVTVLSLRTLRDADEAAYKIIPDILAKMSEGKVPNITLMHVKGTALERAHRRLAERLLLHRIPVRLVTLDESKFLEDLSKAFVDYPRSQESHTFLLSHGKDRISASELQKVEALVERVGMQTRVTNVLHEIFEWIGDRAILEQVFEKKDANWTLRHPPDELMAKTALQMGAGSAGMLIASLILKHVLDTSVPSWPRVAGYTLGVGWQFSFTYMATWLAVSVALFMRGEPSVLSDETDNDGDQLLKDESELRVFKISLIRQLIFALPMFLAVSSFSWFGLTVTTPVSIVMAAFFGWVAERRQHKGYLRREVAKAYGNEELARKQTEGAAWATKLWGMLVVPVVVFAPFVFSSVGHVGPFSVGELVAFALMAAIGTGSLIHEHFTTESRRVSAWAKALYRLTNALHVIRGRPACVAALTVSWENLSEEAAREPPPNYASMTEAVRESELAEILERRPGS